MFEILAILIVFGIGVTEHERAVYYYHRVTSSSADFKTYIVRHIVKQMRTHGVTVDDIAQGLAAQTDGEKIAAQGGNNVTKVFAYLGGTFVLAGVCAYVGAFWEDMNSVVRVIITLGLGAGLTVFGIIAHREGRFPRIVTPVMVAAAFACASGGFVLLHELFPDSNDPSKATLLVFTFMSLHQLLVYQHCPRTPIVMMGTFFLFGALGTAFDQINIVSYVAAMVLGIGLIVVSQGLAKTRHATLVPVALVIGAVWFNIGLFDYVKVTTGSEDWAAIFTGASVFALGYGLKRGAETNLVGLAFLAGTGIFYMGLYELVEKTPYELLFLLAATGMVFVCVALQSRAVLFTSVIAILGFLGYYTEEYFAQSLGWPVALILMGFACIGVSMGALRLSRRIREFGNS